MEMRQRKTEDSKVAEPSAPAPVTAPAIRKPANEQIVSMFKQLYPLLKQVGNLIDAAHPLIMKASAEWDKIYVFIEPYHPVDLIPIFWGFILMFFGGSYFTTIAAVEAYRIFGWQQTRDALGVLYANFVAATIANKKDDTVDDDHDGIADVEQISAQALFTRKVLLAMRTVNPAQLNDAIGAITTGFLAVLATLRSQYAVAITLGHSIGQILERLTSSTIEPVLLRLCPDDYDPWVPVVLKYICSSLGISVAWFIQRIISAFHSSIRGSFDFANGLMYYLVAHRSMNAADVEKSREIYILLAMAIGFLGFYWQLRSGFSLRFPLNFLLFPLSIVETVLMHAVGTAAA